jgi:sugar phosphate isomerase/epimerase
VHIKGFLDYPNEIGFPKTLISDVPWKETIDALKMIGYDDYLTVEIKNDEMDPIDNIFNYSKELTDIINQTL